MSQNKEVKNHIRYDQDTKRYHRFQIEFDDEDIGGTIYISKQERPLPIRLILDRIRN